MYKYIGRAEWQDEDERDGRACIQNKIEGGGGEKNRKHCTSGDAAAAAAGGYRRPFLNLPRPVIGIRVVQDRNGFRCSSCGLLFLR